MTLATFSHALLWNQPLSTLCFFSLGMSFISLWVRKTAWLWGSFLIIAYILAFQANIVNWLSAIPLSLLFSSHYFLRRDLHKGIRFLLVGIVTAVSYALIFHFLPGFQNWRILQNETFSANAYPINLWINFDKPFIGIFVLAFSLPLISSRVQLIQMLKSAIPMSLAGIAILMTLSLKLGIVAWDPKVPVVFFIWFANNLIFVTIPEEAFFRGFLQKEINRWFGTTALAGCASVIVTSILFTLAHLGWVADFSLIGLTFAASLIYGTIYQTTQRIEASILCHFGVNVTHLLLFTYPSLLPSV